MPIQAKGSGLEDILSYMNRCNDGALIAITIKMPESVFTPHPGHAFVAEKIGSRVQFLDPQSGTVFRNPERLFALVRNDKTLFMRVDDLEITDRGIAACKGE